MGFRFPPKRQGNGICGIDKLMAYGINIIFCTHARAFTHARTHTHTNTHTHTKHTDSILPNTNVLKLGKGGGRGGGPAIFTNGLNIPYFYRPVQTSSKWTNGRGGRRACKWHNISCIKFQCTLISGMVRGPLEKGKNDAVGQTEPGDFQGRTRGGISTRKGEKCVRFVDTMRPQTRAVPRSCVVTRLDKQKITGTTRSKNQPEKPGHPQSRLFKRRSLSVSLRRGFFPILYLHFWSRLFLSNDHPFALWYSRKMHWSRHHSVYPYHKSRTSFPYYAHIPPSIFN